MFTTLISGFAADVVTSVDLSGVDFTPIVTAINSAVPAVLTAIIPITGTRKVISFIMGAVKGA